MVATRPRKSKTQTKATRKASGVVPPKAQAQESSFGEALLTAPE
jgi:hypothetical protein